MAHYVGIDIGKNFHAYAVVDDNGTRVAAGEFTATVDGFTKLKKQLLKYAVVMIGMEATGHYWRNLWQALADDYPCRLLNPSATVYFRRMSLTKHKTDALDALCIARYLATCRPEARNMNAQVKDGLRALSRAQATNAEQISEAVNRLHMQLDLSFPEYPKLVGRLDSPKSLALLTLYPTASQMSKARKLADKRYGHQNHRIGEALAKRLKDAANTSIGCGQTSSDALLVAHSVRHIQLLQSQSKALLDEIESLILEHDQDAANLISIPGIAIKSAAAVIGEVGDIQRFDAPKKLTGYVGAHPRFHDSGNKSAHPRMSKAGNKKLRRILWQCTIVAMKYNPIIQAHYQKKLAEGKKKMVAIGHCMNKLIHIIWGVLTYHEPFDAKGGIRSQMATQNNQ